MGVKGLKLRLESYEKKNTLPCCQHLLFPHHPHDEIKLCRISSEHRCTHKILHSKRKSQKIVCHSLEPYHGLLVSESNTSWFRFTAFSNIWTMVNHSHLTLLKRSSHWIVMGGIWSILSSSAFRWLLCKHLKTAWIEIASFTLNLSVCRLLKSSLNS